MYNQRSQNTNWHNHMCIWMILDDTLLATAREAEAHRAGNCNVNHVWTLTIVRQICRYQYHALYFVKMQQLNDEPRMANARHICIKVLWEKAVNRIIWWVDIQDIVRCILVNAAGIYRLSQGQVGSCCGVDTSMLCHINGSVQERRNSIANALELRLSGINPSI